MSKANTIDVLERTIENVESYIANGNHSEAVSTTNLINAITENYQEVDRDYIWSLSDKFNSFEMFGDNEHNELLLTSAQLDAILLDFKNELDHERADD
ncbi:hypothetical protein GKZ90_0021160 [Flavobacterium sp. MC2016-06]|uniref:hypothetical protein n=1 Tax=Flavobacterium sp. MC2016-06 TaxID=2676308 RepID=UPI0012BB0918|nr:hypothetical protein [Flavobacterium sp. MC2016-06]MBU3861011.1 hypothetical protein [Flavobacterium sp. MC2016-06]